MSELSRLSVLVPLYNEAGTVCTLLERVRAVPIAKEVIVVDDGSSDGSAQVVEEYANALPEAPDFRLVVERHQDGEAALSRHGAGLSQAPAATSRTGRRGTATRESLP